MSDQGFIGWCKTDVSTWTENTILEGAEPTLEGFVAEYKDYDHDALINLIVSEMERVKAIVEKEMTVDAKREAQGVKGCELIE